MASQPTTIKLTVTTVKEIPITIEDSLNPAEKQPVITTQPHGIDAKPAFTEVVLDDCSLQASQPTTIKLTVTTVKEIPITIEDISNPTEKQPVITIQPDGIDAKTAFTEVVLDDSSLHNSRDKNCCEDICCNFFCFPVRLLCPCCDDDISRPLPGRALNKGRNESRAMYTHANDTITDNDYYYDSTINYNSGNAECCETGCFGCTDDGNDDGGYYGDGGDCAVGDGDAYGGDGGEYGGDIGGDYGGGDDYCGDTGGDYGGGDGGGGDYCGDTGGDYGGGGDCGGGGTDD